MSFTCRRLIFFFLCSAFLFGRPRALAAQSTYTSQLTGVVKDSSGAVVPGAKVILTDQGTNVPLTTQTDGRGVYVFTGIRPATYTLRVEAAKFAVQERKDVVLGVNQQASIDFTVVPGTVSEVVTVTEQAPLLDTGNATLGTDVTNEYVRDIPLPDRSFFGLVFLAAGVTEAAGSGIQDSYPSGTNFVSNGQRNATAEVRLDGALTSAPEQGEGGTTNVYYQPSVEIVQEFKVENNSFSAEYGNNGGTVMNLVLKEGGNQFHGSGWWFGQRSALDANDFFNNAAGIPKPDHLRDQYGFSLGGPIRKEKTFFFVDFEKVRDNSAINFSGNVPTADERLGNFSADGTNIYNPTVCASGPPPPGSPCAQRQQFIGDSTNLDANGNSLAGVANVIPTSMFDSIGQKLINLYPMPNVQGNPNFNYRQSTVAASSGYQFDVKIDQHFNDKMHLSGRYSHLYSDFSTPYFLADGTDAAGNTINDGLAGKTVVNNAGLEFNWALTPTTLWTSRFALDRVSSPGNSLGPTLSSVGFPPILQEANGLDRMPTIQMDYGDPYNQLSLFNQCCTDVTFAHTLYSYSSAVSLIRGRHTIKTGFEQRQFFNNFGQPSNPTGLFYFPQNITALSPTDTTPGNGNPFADLLIGYGDPGNSFINIQPNVADKSWETAFYVQDDFKLNAKLTLNLGLRYEWSTPYTERYNHQQYSDFTGNTGVTVPLPSPLDPNTVTPTQLTGTTLFVGQGGLGRHLPVDRNNVAPRLGFAYSFDQKTVIRGGAGIYYGLNPATNFQYPGAAFSATANALFTTDNFNTRFATLENPFPNGLPQLQGTTYGANPNWGFSNSNNLGTQTALNAEIYQWNIGIQRLLPWDVTFGIDYSANRSTHLPWGGDNVTTTRNRDFLSSDVRAQISAQQHALDPQCDVDGCVSNYLEQLVNNPFQSMFTQVPGQPPPIFNSPASLYNQAQLPLVNLLRPYPQFDGSFTGMPNLGANASYNAMEIRFQKRANHYVSFEGNYTLSKATDDSSAGFNAFVGTLNAGNVQELDRLKLEHGISANDATNRFVLAAIVDLPVGRGLWIGRDMNRVLDGFVGGWEISTLITRQTGQPLAFSTSEGANGAFIDGNQRPNIVCNAYQLGSGISYHQAAANGLDDAANPSANLNQSVFNASCFKYPGDETPGDASRYIPTLRTDGVHSMDLAFMKEFTIREGMTLQLRGEFFNFTNTPRFAAANTSVDSSGFGTVTSTANTPRHTQFGLRFQF
jgi:Carboxypeptidase regulatory-like domain/TonB dependent receptor